jgi:5-methylcytosine-specific restriction endonuclease McrA
MNSIIVASIIWHWSSYSYYRRRWREHLFKKQEGLCFYCKKPMSLTARTKKGGPARNFATFEHLQRLVDGGKTNSHNVVLACRICNHKANTEIQRRNREAARVIDRLVKAGIKPGGDPLRNNPEMQ